MSSFIILQIPEEAFPNRAGFRLLLSEADPVRVKSFASSRTVAGTSSVEGVQGKLGGRVLKGTIRNA